MVPSNHGRSARDADKTRGHREGGIDPCLCLCACTVGAPAATGCNRKGLPATKSSKQPRLSRIELQPAKNKSRPAGGLTRDSKVAAVDLAKRAQKGRHEQGKDLAAQLLVDVTRQDRRTPDQDPGARGDEHGFRIRQRQRYRPSSFEFFDIAELWRQWPQPSNAKVLRRFLHRRTSTLFKVRDVSVRRCPRSELVRRDAIIFIEAVTVGPVGPVRHVGQRIARRRLKPPAIEIHDVSVLSRVVVQHPPR
jgi:hypothetical protein